jgi:hypothetical protein
LAGDPTPIEQDGHETFRRIEVQTNDDVHLVEYTDGTFATVRGWEAYDRLSSAIDWLGFADAPEGEPLDQITFDTPLEFLPLPIATGTWTDQATVTVPGEGTYNATFTGRVIGREDLPLPVDLAPTPVYYKDAWKVARTLEVTLDDVWFSTLTDTTWYSPTLGPVRDISWDESSARGDDPAGWYRAESWRDPRGTPNRK